LERFAEFYRREGCELVDVLVEKSDVSPDLMEARAVT
jgi:hypothetical protein